MGLFIGIGGAGRRGKGMSDKEYVATTAAVLNTFITADLTDDFMLTLTTPEGSVGATFELKNGDLTATI
ncbi:MAG: hypothetical protein WCR71_04150 [Bacteroidales bacterium]